MIQINDNDKPIDVANKIIYGTKTFEPPAIIKLLRKENGLPEEITDRRFTLGEIKQIADHLLVYYTAMSRGDDDGSMGNVL